MTTWMDLESIMLSEISQRKTDTVRSHLYVKSRKQNNMKTDSQIQRTNVVAKWKGSGSGWRKLVKGIKSINLQLHNI